MRESGRKTNNNKSKIDDKLMLYSIIGVTAIILIIVAILIFGKNNEDVKYGATNTNKITRTINSVYENTESASTDMGKTVNEVQSNMTNQVNTSNTTNTTNSLKSTNSTNSTNTTKANTTTRK